MRCRISLETDAVNDYFQRILDKGENEIYIRNKDNLTRIETGGFNLDNGIATLNLKLPPSCKVNDSLHYEVHITDPSQLKPFVNRFIIYVEPPVIIHGSKGKRIKPPASETGSDRDVPGGIKLPNIKRIQEEEWEKRKFNKYTALKIKHAGQEQHDEEESTSEGKDIFDFFVNIDNIYLNHEKKRSSEEPELIEERFVLGVVLIGMGLLQEDLRKEPEKKDEDEQTETNGEINIEDTVEHVTRAIAPVLLPMIDYLGSLSIEDPSLELEVSEVT